MKYDHGMERRPVSREWKGRQESRKDGKETVEKRMERKTGEQKGWEGNR